MLLQLAIDRPEHFAVVAKVADLIDILELGTPVLKRFGIGAIPTLAELAPGVPILADTKTADAGLLEAQMVYAAGARLMTVLSSASAATHAVIAKFAAEHDLHVVVDTITETGSDQLIRPGQVFPSNFAYVAVHFPSDQRLAGDTSTGHIDSVRHMHELGYRVSIAGGISPDNIGAVVEVAPEIVVVGSAITESSDPRGVAQWMRSQLQDPGHGWPSDKK